MLWLLLGCACAVLLYLWRRYKRRRILELISKTPTLKGLPVIGNIFLLNGDGEHLWNTLEKLMSISNSVGGVLAVWWGENLSYIITDPDDANTIMTNCNQKNRDLHDWGANYVGDCLGNADVTKWKRSHTLFHQTFLENLDLYQEGFNLYARSLVRSLEVIPGKGATDIHPQLSDAVFKVVRSNIIGTSNGYEQFIDNKYKDALDNILEILVKRLCNAFLHIDWIYKFSKLKEKEDELVQIVHTQTEKVISIRKTERREDKRNRSIKSTYTGTCFKSFLDVMLDLAEYDQVFTDEHIRNEVNGLIIEHNTQICSILLVLIMLGSRPEVQNRVYDEVITLVGLDQDVTSSHKLTYLDAVVNEVLRLYPPISLVSRSIEKEIQLKNYTLPAGCSATIGFFGIHRSPVWGVDADQFRPERWLRPGSLPKNPGAFSSFSLGPRNCPAKAYALSMLKTFVVHIVRRYKISTDPKIQWRYNSTLKPVSNTYMTLELR